jgi:hypothetical protein
LAQSKEIEPPTSKLTERNGKIGTTWTLPHSLTPIRPEFVGKEDSNLVGLLVDVIYHPSAFGNSSLKKLLIETALDSLESKLQLKIDRRHTSEVAGIQYFGTKINTTIRERTTTANSNNIPKEFKEKEQFLKELEKKGTESIPIPQNSSGHTCQSESITEPKHVIVHQHDFDMKHHITRDLISPERNRPQKLVIRIELPKISQIDQVDLKMTKDQVILNVPNIYHTVISLPFHIHDQETKAQWLVDKKRLELTCFVLSSFEQEKNLKEQLPGTSEMESGLAA